MTTHHPRPDTQQVRLSGPAHLLQAVPYLLGHHGLRDDLILLATRNKRTVLTARIDLSALADATVWAHAAQALDKAMARTIYLIAYPARIDDTTLEHLHKSFRTTAALCPGGLVLAQTITTCEDSWWTHDLTTPAPYGPGQPIVADDCLDLNLSITHGTPAASRHDVLQTLAPHPPTVRNTVRDALADLGRPTRRERQTTAAAALSRRRSRPVPWNVPEAAAVLDALNDVIVRDTMTLRCVDEHATWTWQTLLPYAPTTHTAPVATLAAIAAHQRGNGVLARGCIQRAREADPDYALARMFEQVLDYALTPEDVRANVLAPSRAELETRD
jgi:hypothetical protein